MWSLFLARTGHSIQESSSDISTRRSVKKQNGISQGIPWWFPKKINYSGQIIIFHQPRFPWNKGISLTKPPFGVRSCEVAIIWPDYSYLFRFLCGYQWLSKLSKSKVAILKQQVFSLKFSLGKNGVSNPQMCHPTTKTNGPSSCIGTKLLWCPGEEVIGSTSQWWSDHWFKSSTYRIRGWIGVINHFTTSKHLTSVVVTPVN